MLHPVVNWRRRNSSASNRCRALAPDVIRLSIRSMCLTQGAEGLPCGQHVLEFVVVVQPAFLQVDGDHLAGPDAPLFDDLVSSIRTMPVSEPTISSPSPVTV